MDDLGKAHFRIVHGHCHHQVGIRIAVDHFLLEREEVVGEASE